MKKKTLNILEYDKILNKLKDLATTDEGKKICLNLMPSTDPVTIEKNLMLTSEAESIIYKHGTPHFTKTVGIIESLKKSSINSMLTTKEIVNIRYLLSNVNTLSSYLKEDDNYPNIKSIISMLIPLPKLISAFKYIHEDGIENEASNKLSDIRNKITISQESLRKILNDILSKNGDYLQESVITMRNGRYCIPVKSEYKNAIKGIIHDSSATGQTFFIEPLSVIDKNNQIDLLYSEEEHEIERILLELTELVNEHSQFIDINYKIISELDFIFAKGELSIYLNCTKPKINTNNRIYLNQARHPLIDKKIVVPISLHLDKNINQMIITGPNTGGKTVTLKTIGLLTIMAQSGLNIPTNENSEITIYENIFADIGDEQSIEQSLSTFSSHMTNIVSILNEFSADSLILFDELGAGTDPIEGAGLALAILDYLNENNVMTVATTHYSEIKYYATTTPGVINASCEFDINTLRPTYKLIVGVAGKSNAFEIAKKIGISEYIIDKAKNNIKDSDIKIEESLVDLDNQRLGAVKLLEEAQIKYKEAEELLELANEEKNKIQERKEKIINRANQEASRILENAKNIADEAIKEFNKIGKNTNIQELEKNRSKLTKGIKKTQSNKSISKQNDNEKIDISKIKIGSKVHVNSFNQDAVVKSLPDPKGYIFVNMGMMNVKVKIDDISKNKFDDNDSNTKVISKFTKKTSSAMTIKPEIKLLGYTGVDAISELDKYIDDCVIAGLNSIRIVHGKGSGKLRAQIHEYLRKHPSISSFDLAEYGQGDAGVTIANLK